MLRTREAKFRVSGIQPTHVWFEVLHGDDAGRRVSIPLYTDKHTDDITETIQSLTEDDVVTATLESESETEPSWHVTSIDTHA